jgi:Amt family ammonium transporter
MSRIGRILHYYTCNCVQYGGLAGPHAVIATILHSFLAMGVVSVLWVIFGFSLAFGEDDGHG